MFRPQPHGGYERKDAGKLSVYNKHLCHAVARSIHDYTVLHISWRIRLLETFQKMGLKNVDRHPQGSQNEISIQILESVLYCHKGWNMGFLHQRSIQATIRASGQSAPQRLKKDAETSSAGRAEFPGSTILYRKVSTEKLTKSTWRQLLPHRKVKHEYTSSEPLTNTNVYYYYIILHC